MKLSLSQTQLDFNVCYLVDTFTATSVAGKAVKNQIYGPSWTGAA